MGNNRWRIFLCIKQEGIVPVLGHTTTWAPGLRVQFQASTVSSRLCLSFFASGSNRDSYEAQDNRGGSFKFIVVTQSIVYPQAPMSTPL